MDLFWTIPSADDVTPTDPLGLDAMREELADKLVPCLTGRTWRHEDFYWSLTFVNWSSIRVSEKDRISQFLNYERWLKLCWFDQGQESFPGFRQAKKQASGKGAPSKTFVPLLKNQRSQGLLGAHLGPLRSIDLVCRDALALTKVGKKLVEGADPPIRAQELPDAQWDKWHERFARARRSFCPGFKRELRERLKSSMPLLPNALAQSGWSSRQAWTQTAKYLGPRLSSYARLAGEFIDWADNVRNYFEGLRARRSPETLFYPPKLRSHIPEELKYWEPFQAELRNWNPQSLPAALARIHKTIFHRRHYSDSELWVELRDGELRWRVNTATDKQPAEGSDCRWSNAVALLKP